MTILQNKQLITELSHDVGRLYNDLCELADFYHEDREDVIDLFIYIFTNVADKFDAKTFNIKDKGYLS